MKHIQGKNVLLTGGAGFLGLNLLEVPAAGEWDVTVFELDTKRTKSIGFLKNSMPYGYA